jgi:glycine betaine catabolism A
MPAGLGREYFTCSDVYRRETETIFARSWLCGPRTAELRAGEYITVNIAGQPLILARQSDQSLRALHNVCRHRGALLCDVPQGQLNLKDASGPSWTCPYHAWAYDHQGQLVRAPNMSSESKFDKTPWQLVTLSCHQWNGYAMVHLDPAAEFTRDFQPITERLAAWRLDRLFLADSLHYTVAANWKLLFHNFSECYHCPTVHPTLNRLTPYKSAENDLLQGPFLGGPMQLADGVHSMTLDGRPVGPKLPELTIEQQRQVAYYTICPTMFISPHPDYVMVHRLNRVAVDRTDVTCEFLLPAADGDYDRDRLASASEFWDQTNRQDWEVCERVQQGASSRAFQPAVYSPLETVLPHFDRHYLAQLGVVAG